MNHSGFLHPRSWQKGPYSAVWLKLKCNFWLYTRAKIGAVHWSRRFDLFCRSWSLFASAGTYLYCQTITVLPRKNFNHIDFAFLRYRTVFCHAHPIPSIMHRTKCACVKYHVTTSMCDKYSVSTLKCQN